MLFVVFIVVVAAAAAVVVVLVVVVFVVVVAEVVVVVVVVAAAAAAEYPDLFSIFPLFFLTRRAVSKIITESSQNGSDPSQGEGRRRRCSSRL